MTLACAPAKAAMLAIVCALSALCLMPLAAGTAIATSTADSSITIATPVVRVEARSPDLLAVGIVQGDRLVVHLSRLVDNAPLRDAALTVLLRGVEHPTTAEADGSYSLETPELRLPGSAAVVFQVSQGSVRENLEGALEIAGTREKTEDKNSTRQLGWWVLNFAVCIGFLMLLSRRRKAAAAAED